MYVCTYILVHMYVCMYVHMYKTDYADYSECKTTSQPMTVWVGASLGDGVDDMGWG